DLRGEIRRARREGYLERDRARILRERLVEIGRALLAVGAVVVQEPDPQVLRDQILGVAERDPVVRRRDPEDVRPLLWVDEPRAAVVDDADRNVVPVRDLPGRVDAGAI